MVNFKFQAPQFSLLSASYAYRGTCVFLRSWHTARLTQYAYTDDIPTCNPFTFSRHGPKTSGIPSVNRTDFIFFFGGKIFEFQFVLRETRFDWNKLDSGLFHT